MCKLLFISLLIVVQFSCAHKHATFSEEDEGNDKASLVSLTVQLITTSHFYAPIDNSLQSRTKNNNLPKRFIIEARQDNKTIARQVLVIENNNNENEKDTVSVSLQLPAERHRLVAWMDHTDGSDDLYYITQDLQYITCVEPYSGNTSARKCLFGTQTVDLTSCARQTNAQAQTTMELSTPLAKYAIIATDLQDFLHSNANDIKAGEKYYVTFSYNYFFPMEFNTLKGAVSDSWENVSFTVPLKITDPTQKECLLGRDYIFADTTTQIVLLAVKITDSRQRVITSIPKIEIPYKRGCTTDIRGDFLCNQPQNGFEIKTEYDDEIYIDLDNLF